MRTFPFLQVDAFTTEQLHGNPCAVLLDCSGIDDSTMLKIAGENNLSETVFISESSVADFSLRFFTPAEEVPLAGHPTIAAAHALVEVGRILLTDPTTTVTFELIVGVIQVEIRSDSNKVSEIRMSQLKPQFLRTYSGEDIFPLFSLDPSDQLPNTVLQTVSTGTPQLMIPVRDLKTLTRVQFRVDKYIQFRKTADFFSPHVFCLEGATSDGNTFARHFFPPPDVVEDPFTGFGTGGMAAYMWHYGLLDHPHFVAQQGHFLGRPGTASVEVHGPREAIENVVVAGQAVTCISGEFFIRI